MNGFLSERILFITMAFVGVNQYNHNQIDEYEYDDTENFYDDAGNYGNYLDVDDSEGKFKLKSIKKIEFF